MTGIALPAASPVRARMRALADRRFAASMDVPTRFFEANADAISRACVEMAQRFQAGGRLLVIGDGAAATDAQHVAVEFVHPVLVGKRALPALSLGGVAAAGSPAIAGGPAASRAPGDPGTAGDSGFTRTLRVVGRPNDILMGISGASSRTIAGALLAARGMGMLTIALDAEGAANAGSVAELRFTVPSADAMVVQEVHEMLYHVLWELVHVFLDREAPR